MTQPLALILYEKLLPGTQVVNRLQDLGWRVQTVNDASALGHSAEEHKPVLVLADLTSSRSSVCDGITQLRKNESTSHIPVIAWSTDESKHTAAISAGASLVVSDTAILQHLSQVIEQALSQF